MTKIQFKGKIQTVYSMDDTVAYHYIRVPVFQRHHCDMPAFRSHHKYGAYANSDLFPGMLARIRQELFMGDELRLGSIPHGVTVDTSGFLAKVEFDL